jgi:hypothetical protein
MLTLESLAAMPLDQRHLALDGLLCDSLERFQRRQAFIARAKVVACGLLWALVLFLAASVFAGCGEPPGLAEGTAAAETDAPACDEGLGKVQAAVKCDWQSSYASPGPVLCFEHGAPRGGCTVEEQDNPTTPAYRTLCVAACPQGMALMSPEAVAYLRSAHPELF